MLNWQHIKGFNGSTASANDTTYTFFEYQYTNASYLYAGEQYLPKVYLSPYNNIGTAIPTGAYDCGHIVTNNVQNTIKKHLVLNNSSEDGPFLSFWGDSGFSFNNNGGTGPTDAYAYFNISNNELRGTTYNTPIHLILNNSVDHTTGDIYFGSSTAPYAYFGDHNINNFDLKVYGSINTNNYIKTTQYCEATYFNATSDIRAKENLKSVPTNMLDIVKKIEVYTFNYKSQPTVRSIGIIAQDVRNLNIDGFSLVTNQNATGENNDYMSVHESKLVYILIEAVKELSEKVDKLEKELYASK